MSRRLIPVLTVGLIIALAVGLLAAGGGTVGATGVRSAPASAPAARPSASPRPRWGRLTDEQQTELLTFLKRNRPDFHDRLVKRRKEDPRAYRRMLMGTWRWYMRFKAMSPEAQKAALDLQDLQSRMWRLLKKIRKDGQSQADASELRTVVAAQFDAEQILRRARLAQLEQEIKNLKDGLKRRADQRDEIVSSRVTKHLVSTTRPAWPRHGPPRGAPTSMPSSRPVK